MQTKKCNKCQQVKPISEFHPHKPCYYQSSCKDCQREAMRIYNRTPERREYNRKIREQMRADGYFKEYEQRPDVKRRKAEHQKIYRQDPRLRIRHLARWYARRMTENGTLKQQPCALCDDGNTQRHHPDYNEPL